MPELKQTAQEILKQADIEIDGNRDWDIKINDKRFYARVLSQGSLGLGESYMDGYWDCKRLDIFFTKILSMNLDKAIINKFDLIRQFIKARVLNAQRKSNAFKIGKKHYDIGNDLYKAMLDKRLTYTCGYWQNAKTLNEAQEAKMDLICKKLKLKKGQKILDIGCGWGSFLKFAAEKYKVKGFGVTVSKEQVELGNKLCKGLDVEIKLQDYRELNEKFDHIVSLGMFEHVGYKNYKQYMEVVHRCLKDDGLFILHTIGGNKSVKSVDAWINKYIFPNGMLPSIKQIGESIENLFVLEDWHSFGAYYDKTLMAWFNNFDKSWDRLKKNYSPKFYRMWKYYLLACAGSFRARKNQLWQIVLSKNGVPGGYERIV